MSWMRETPLAVVFRRRENQGEPVNDRRLKARIARDEIIRVAAGSYAHAAKWHALKPMAQHAQRVWEAAARIQPGAVFSHFAAAALHGIDILGEGPATIDVSIASAGGGRSSGGIRRHARDLEGVQIQPWGLHAVTTPLQTALDLAVSLTFVDAVVVVDQALWARRGGGPLVTQRQLLEAARAYEGRSAARVMRVAEFGTSLADSVRESQSRVLIDAMGFPEPELQSRFVLPDGNVVFTDFFWRGALARRRVRRSRQVPGSGTPRGSKGRGDLDCRERPPRRASSTGVRVLTLEDARAHVAEVAL